MSPIAFALLFLGHVAPAHAQDLRIGITNTITGEARTDNGNGRADDDNYGVIVDRLNLSGTAGGLTAQVRIDAFKFIDPPPGTFRDDVIPERLTARYKIGDWVLTGGDFYKQLGRGIALSIRKIDEELVDVSIQGGQVEFRADGRAVSLFAGRANTANLDAVSQKFVQDTGDVIVGGSFDVTEFSAVKLGMWGVYITPTQRILDERSESITGGMSVSLPNLTDWLSIYIETDYQRREVVGLEENGIAAYGTVDLTFDALSFLLEGLYLDTFEQRGSTNTALGQSFVYNQPPTLTRIDQEISNNRDVAGGRLKAEYYIEDADVLLFLNGTYRQNDKDAAATDDIHAYGGAELFYQEGKSRVTTSGGYRHESRAGNAFKTIGHGEVDYLQWLVDTFSLHLQVLHESRTQEEDPWERGSVIGSVEWSGVGSLAFEFGYDTQNPSDDVTQLFYSAVIDWRATDWLDLRLLAGTRRGGIRCIAGVCRNFPAFAGVQGKVIARY